MLTIDHLLAHSCSNPDNAFDPAKSIEENQNPEGFNLYRIELHCIAYKISARKVTDGIFNQETNTWDIPPHFDIRSYELEAC